MTKPLYRISSSPSDYDTTFFLSCSGPRLVYLFIIILANNTAHWEVEREKLVVIFCVLHATDSDDSV